MTCECAKNSGFPKYADSCGSELRLQLMFVYTDTCHKQRNLLPEPFHLSLIFSKKKRLSVKHAKIN